MRLLVTGSRGFIGGSVGRFFAQAGHEVLGLSRSSQPAADWSGRHFQADVASADISTVVREFAPDVIFHAAGTASVGASFNTPLDDLRAAALTWANTLDGVRRSGRQPLILFPSSAAVYGNPPQLPVTEEMPVDPISPYGFHKAACELLAREYAKCFDLNIVVCRLFSVFGVAQRRLLVWELYQQFANLKDIIWLQGTGTESRDYLHIDDVAAALLLLIDADLHEANQGRCIIVNIAGGVEIKVQDIALHIRSLVAPEKQIRFKGVERLGDPHRWWADTSVLRRMTPLWKPQSFSATMALCVEAWQREANSVRHGF